MLADNERRLINYFKQFMEKSVVPTIKNYGTVMADWQSFSVMIGGDAIDHSRIQAWLEGRSSSVKMFPNPGFTIKKEDDKSKGSSGFLKRKEEPATESPVPEPPGTYTFNSNKTFGGERARMNMFPLKPPSMQDKKDDKPQQPTGAERILTGMESLYKTLSDNQYRFEHHTNGTANPNPPPTSTLSTNQPYKYEERRYG